MAAVAQLVRAPDCDSGCRRFKSGRPPQSPRSPWLLSPRCVTSKPRRPRPPDLRGNGRAPTRPRSRLACRAATLMEAAGRAVAACRHWRYLPATGRRAVRPRQQRRRRLRGGAASAGGGLAGAARPCSASAGSLRGDAAWAAGQWTGRGRAAVARSARRPAPGDRRAVRRRPDAADRRHRRRADRAHRSRDALTVVAVDVPSGLHGDSGEIMGCAPHADAHGDVLSRQARPLFPRRTAALRRARGRRHRHSASVLDEIAPRLWLNAPPLWRAASAARRPRRPQICARPCHDPGGRDRHWRGAAWRHSAARRAGAGLVTIATPPAALAVYRSAEPGNLVDDVRGRHVPSADCSRTSGATPSWSGPAPASSERTRAAALGGAGDAAGRSCSMPTPSRSSLEHPAEPVLGDPGPGFAHAP